MRTPDRMCLFLKGRIKHAANRVIVPHGVKAKSDSRSVEAHHAIEDAPLRRQCEAPLNYTNIVLDDSRV